MSETLFVSVYLDQNLTKPLDYSVPREWNSLVEVGSRVEVPLRKSLKKGTIFALKKTASISAVKPIARILSPKSELSPIQWKLAEWMSHYYATPLQKILKCFIPPHRRREVQPKKQIFLTLTKPDPETIKACEDFRTTHPPSAQILEALLQEKKGRFLSELLAEIKCPRSTFLSLIQKKYIAAQTVIPSEEMLLEEEFFPTKLKELNLEQKHCLEQIKTSLEKTGYSTHLIHGVTGSGKTEVYLQAIGSTLALGKSALLLVPEISLTSQTIEKLRSRFSEKIGVLHHRRSLGERTSVWEDLREGKIRIVIGARSAVFCPIQNLGLIIVDEEHDTSYKQSEETPCYHGRDVAVMRGHLEQCTVLLGSATPSIESRYNAEIKKYQLHILSHRATAAPLPTFHIVDMKRAMDQNGGFTHFSDPLLQGLKKRIQCGEQTLLFLNRRGYHRMQVCAQCRWMAKCPHCDLSLTYHRDAHHLQCHLCQFTKPSPKNCPQCSTPETLQFKGFGTEHVERSLHAILPGVRTLRMDRDTTKGKNSHEDIFKQFRAHKADVLIGTQMIAKGFHFPSVTLVGVLNIDASLCIPDFRAPEHLFQLLIQVGGRSGRSHLPGEVILQTFLPDHPLFQFAVTQDYDAFYKREIEERRLFNYPPFTHLVKCVFSSSDPKKAEESARAARAQLLNAVPPQTEIFPVTPAGHPKVKDLYRFQFLIKTSKMRLIQNQISILNNYQTKIDIDTVSTFY